MNDFEARCLFAPSARSSAFVLGAALLAASGYAGAEPAPATSAAAEQPAPNATAVPAPETSPSAAPVAHPESPPNATAQPPRPAKHPLPDEPLHPDDGRMGTHQEHWLFGIG